MIDINVPADNTYFFQYFYHINIEITTTLTYYFQ